VLVARPFRGLRRLRPDQLSQKGAADSARHGGRGGRASAAPPAAKWPPSSG